MRLALGLAVIGAGLGLVATLGFLSRPVDVGSVSAVETSLTPAAPTETTTTTTAPRSTLADDEPSALWSANEASLLGEDSRPKAPVPVGLRIEALGIDAPVGPYGIDGRGRMDVPDNITEVGWYKFGPAPGEPGSAVLAAHVDLSGPGKGLFYDLDQLDVGDTVSIAFSDESETTFEVVARATYLKTELPLARIFSEEGSPVLTLVTCGGGFSRSARSYDSNVVVYAVPVGTPAAGDPNTAA